MKKNFNSFQNKNFENEEKNYQIRYQNKTLSSEFIPEKRPFQAEKILQLLHTPTPVNTNSLNYYSKNSNNNIKFHYTNSYQQPLIPAIPKNGYFLEPFMNIKGNLILDFNKKITWFVSMNMMNEACYFQREVFNIQSQMAAERYLEDVECLKIV